MPDLVSASLSSAICHCLLQPSVLALCLYHQAPASAGCKGICLSVLSRLARPGNVLLASAVWGLNSYTLRSFTLQA